MTRRWLALAALVVLFATLGTVAGRAQAERGAGPASSTAGPSDPASAAAPSRQGVAVASLPQNLSVWGMFQSADGVVQAVMVGLAVASVLTWTIAIAKGVELVRGSATARGLLARVSAADALVDALAATAAKRSPVARLAEAAAAETVSSAGLAPDGVKERIAVRLERIEAAAVRRMTRGTGLLATIGATAPFVGLFGTVWGIMNAFVGISKAQTTNLAVVAPGIAEALLATAIGLVAAIPAVVVYNVFARAVAGYRHLLADASAAILGLAGRDLDRAARPLLRAAE